jgi:hypothetical protein
VCPVPTQSGHQGVPKPDGVTPWEDSLSPSPKTLAQSAKNVAGAAFRMMRDLKRASALMTLDELRLELAAILAEEEVPSPDWAKVEFLSTQAYVRLTEPGTPQDFPHEDVIGYLAGFIRRRLDKRFGEQQREWIRSYLRES